MFIARFIIDVKFGHKDEFLALQRKWQEEVGARIGWKTLRYATGSIGAHESRMEMELEVGSLAELEKAWAELAKSDAHKRFGKALEPLVVSGSNRWEILRVITPA